MGDDRVDRAEPQQVPEAGPEAPQRRATESGGPAATVDGQKTLPAPPPRPRGRHEAQRSGIGPAGLAIGVVLAAVVLAGVLATRLIGSADSARDPSAPTAAAPAAQAGPTSRPPGAGTFGNLVPNWSFEQDLSGWQVVGTADGAREPQGRTSGSCASVRARGPAPGRIGLTLPRVVPSAAKGDRYVASAWVRSPAPGLRVTLSVVGSGAKAESSRATTATLPGLAWRRVIVAHTVATSGTDLAVEVTADDARAGDTLLVDEVAVRQG